MKGKNKEFNLIDLQKLELDLLEKSDLTVSFKGRISRIMKKTFKLKSMPVKIIIEYPTSFKMKRVEVWNKKYGVIVKRAVKKLNKRSQNFLEI